MGYYYTGVSPIAIIITLLIAVGLAFIPATMARNKGYSYGGFWAFGFFFFLIALIVAACLTDKNQYVRRDEVGYPPPPQYTPNAQQNANATKFCPSCGASLNMQDQFCGHCGAKQ